MWNHLPPFAFALALACTVATPGTVSALLRCYLLATHFGGSLPATFAAWKTILEACR